jgi:hypothetical protein
MADETDHAEPEESDPNQEPQPGSGDADDALLLALVSALVPIFFRRPR